MGLANTTIVAQKAFRATGIEEVSLVSGGITKHGSAQAVTINYEKSLTETIGEGQTTNITGDQTTTTTGKIYLN